MMSDRSTSSSPLQELCEHGQYLLMQTDYLAAEATLAQAEQTAWSAKDWDTLSRLYMPLQEARRQRRQRCGEGQVVLDLVAADASQSFFNLESIIAQYPQAQLLVAGWGTIAPAVQLRALQGERQLYAETFLAAVYPTGDSAGGSDERVVVIAPAEDARLPEPTPRSRHELMRLLPVHCVALLEADLPRGARTGTTLTYAEIMALWERLHAPFLAAADAMPDPIARMAGYRQTIRVDYACELAHQKLSFAARALSRHERASSRP